MSDDKAPDAETERRPAPEPPGDEPERSFALVGVIFVIGLFWMLVRSAVRIGQRAELRNDFYAAYVAYGLSFLIGVQALVNIGVNMGLFPTKGLTLPLVSYGGSSLLIVFVMLGVLLRIDAENTMAESSPAPRQGGRQ